MQRNGNSQILDIVYELCQVFYQTLCLINKNEEIKEYLELSTIENSDKLSQIFFKFNEMTSLRDCVIIGNELRSCFRRKYGYVIPLIDIFESIVRTIPKELTILEVGCGKGLLASLLRLHDYTVYATDSGEWYSSDDILFTSIEEIDNIEAIQKYNNANVLMISWAVKDSSMAFDSLVLFTGQYVINIGDRSKCGTLEYYKMLESWDILVEIACTDWLDESSMMTIYKRRIE